MTRSVFDIAIKPIPSEIEKGTLVQLFDVAVPAESAYWIVWPEAMLASDRVLAFRDWMRAETAATREKPRARHTARSAPT